MNPVTPNPSNPITLSRMILAEPSLQANNDLVILFSSIELACKAIASAVRRAGLTGLYGLEGTENASGDQVKKLDVLSNEIFKNALRFSTKISVMVSEEEEDPVEVEEGANADTKYCIAFDPLDGSSNIDCNVSTGTIFAVYERQDPRCKGHTDILQPGKNLRVAGYCMYGSSTQLVVTWGKGVYGFTLDLTIGSFVLSHPNITIPEDPKKIFSCNEGNYAKWDAPSRAFLEECKKSEEYKARYVGSMVSDMHRTLLYGGIYLYPSEKRNKQGKLRLLYECSPMAFLVEQAGGLATDGKQRILDIVPDQIHARSPIFLGCKRDVSRVIELYREMS